MIEKIRNISSRRIIAGTAIALVAVFVLTGLLALQLKLLPAKTAACSTG